MERGKALRIIQIIAKVLKIVTLIAFIGCIVAAFGCLMAILGVAGGLEEVITSITDEWPFTTPQLYSFLALVILLCIAGAITMWFTYRYLRNEIAAGTPFTLQGAKEMFRLGLITLITDFVAATVAGISLLILRNNGVDINNVDLYAGSISGITLLFLSLLFRYGAEIRGEGELLQPEIKTETETETESK